MGAPVDTSWYPGGSTCLNDGNRPSWQQNKYMDQSICCTSHFSWAFKDCMGESDSTQVPTSNPTHQPSASPTKTRTSSPEASATTSTTTYTSTASTTTSTTTTTSTASTTAIT